MQISVRTHRVEERRNHTRLNTIDSEKHTGKRERRCTNRRKGGTRQAAQAMFLIIFILVLTSEWKKDV